MALTAALTVFIFIFAGYVMSGRKDKVIMSLILFISGLIFFALQSVSHALTAETAPEKQRGAAFGMWNLIAEIGAVLSPVISGSLRDSTGGWSTPLILDGVLMGISCLLIMGVGSRVFQVQENEHPVGTDI